MRCPKCHYLSFDPEPRCRNCGYELSLAERDDLVLESNTGSEVPIEDLILRDTRGESPGGADWALDDGSTDAAVADSPESTSGMTGALVNPEAVGGAEAAAPPTAERPLLVRRGRKGPPAEDDDDEVALPPVPSAGRAPLSVRRRVVESVSPRATPPPRKLGPLDRDLLEDLQRLEAEEEATPEPGGGGLVRDAGTGAGAWPRLGAAAIDACVVGGLSAAVLAITLRWCNLPMAQIGILPIVPTAAFLLLVGLGYLLMFTAAGGQTLGKMTMGLRVVADGSGRAGLTLGQAFYRETLAIPSVLMLGFGFIPGLLGDQRALHDRLAHTRVIRA